MWSVGPDCSEDSGQGSRIWVQDSGQRIQTPNCDPGVQTQESGQGVPTQDDGWGCRSVDRGVGIGHWSQIVVRVAPGLWSWVQDSGQRIQARDCDPRVQTQDSGQGPTIPVKGSQLW